MKANWNRFTLMDGVALVAAFALGTRFATHFMLTDMFGLPENRTQPSVEWTVSCVLCSGVIAGPLILLMQRFRGRRSPLSWGEWLWLAPLSLCLVAYASQRLGVHFSFYAILDAVLVQCALSAPACILLVGGLLGMRPYVACRWTDLVGCSVCVAVGPLILYIVNQALGQR
jgi:hypothetical protein